MASAASSLPATVCSRPPCANPQPLPTSGLGGPEDALGHGGAPAWDGPAGYERGPRRPSGWRAPGGASGPGKPARPPRAPYAQGLPSPSEPYGARGGGAGAGSAGPGAGLHPHRGTRGGGGAAAAAAAAPPAPRPRSLQRLLDAVGRLSLQGPGGELLLHSPFGPITVALPWGAALGPNGAAANGGYDGGPASSGDTSGGAPPDDPLAAAAAASPRVAAALAAQQRRAAALVARAADPGASLSGLSRASALLAALPTMEAIRTCTAGADGNDMAAAAGAGALPNGVGPTSAAAAAAALGQLAGMLAAAGAPAVGGQGGHAALFT
jgi:hypothetical protein